MSRFLRFLKVFVVATICTFSALSAHAWTVTLVDTSAKYPSEGAGLTHTGTNVTTFQSGSVNSFTRPYRPGYGYGGHWTGQNCTGTRMIEPNLFYNTTYFPAGTTFTEDTTLYVCWKSILSAVGTEYSTGATWTPRAILLLDVNGGTGGKYAEGLSFWSYNSNSWYGGGTSGVNGTCYMENVGGVDLVGFDNYGDWLLLATNNSGTTNWVRVHKLGFGGAGQSDRCYFATGVFGSAGYTPQRANYVFDGYNQNQNGNGFGVIVADETYAPWKLHGADYVMNNMPGSFGQGSTNTIYAKWKPAVYRVNLAGAGVSPSVVYLRYGATDGGWYDTQAHAEVGGNTGKLTSLTTQPSNGDKIFKGYHVGQNGAGTQLVRQNKTFVYSSEALTAITTNGQTIYPYWEEPPAVWYTLTLNDNGAQTSSNPQVLYYSSSCSSTGYRRVMDCSYPVVNSIVTPKKTGYAYGGHYNNGQMYVTMGGAISFHQLTSDVTATATWAALQFDVNYASGWNGNIGGSAPTNPIRCTYGQSCIAPGSGWTHPTGYVFAGWSCVVNGSGYRDGGQQNPNGTATAPCAQAVYHEGDSLSDATNVETVAGITSITLTALWMPDGNNYHKFTLNSNRRDAGGNDGEGRAGSTESAFYSVENVGWFRAKDIDAQITTTPPNIFRPVSEGGGGLNAPTPPSGKWFVGYFTSPDEGQGVKAVDYAGNILVTTTQNGFTADRTLYAHYADPITVTLHAYCDGYDEFNCYPMQPNWTCSECSVTSIQAVPGRPLPAISCAPTRNQSQFIGYSNSREPYPQAGTLYYYSYGSGSVNPALSVWPDDGPTDLWAVWERVPSSIQYVCDTGNGRKDQAYFKCPEYTVLTGGTPDLCPGTAATSSSTGKKFEHWLLDNNRVFTSGQQVSWEYQVPKDLVAAYRTIYRVQLNHNGADNAAGPNVAYFAGGSWYSDEYATVPLSAMNTVPTKLGYQLRGYKVDGTDVFAIDENGNFISNNNNLTSAINTNNITITANWTVKTYIAALDPQFENGATNTSTGTQKIFYNITHGWVASNGSTTPALPITIPTQAYKIFNGYYLNQNGSGYPIIDSTGQILVTGDDALALFAGGDDITLYAAWQNMPTPPQDENSYFRVTTTTNMPANTTFTFGMSAEGDFYVDWGDGIVENISRTGYDQAPQKYSHTYTAASAEARVIKIWGLATRYKPYWYAATAGSAISFGQTFEGPNLTVINGDAPMTPGLVAGISGSLGAVFPTVNGGGNLNNVPGFQGAFSGCTNLAGTIPYNLFSGVTGNRQNMFLKTFENTAVTGISGNATQQAQLFSGITGAAEGLFRETFSGTNITQIPSAIFSGVSGAADYLFYGTFSGCRSFTADGNGDVVVPSGLFNGVSGAANGMFMNTFYNTNITKVPADLFGRVVSGQYQGVSGAAELMFAATFNASDLAEIPSNSSGSLFAKVINGQYYGVTGAASQLFASTFNNTDITEIPSTLFAGISGAAPEMFRDTFGGTDITQIPSSLFSGVSGADSAMFQWTFRGCTHLTGLPHGLFSGVRGTADKLFDSTFMNCANLTGYVWKDLFNLGSGGLTYNASNSMMVDIFKNTGLATSCSPYNLTEYTTNFSSYWENPHKVICAPEVTFSCTMSGVGGTGTPNPANVWMDQISTLSAMPASSNCTAPANHTATGYWKCTGSDNCSGTPNRWVAGGSLPTWLTSATTPNVHFYMEYNPNTYAVTLNPNNANGGASGNTNMTLYEKYGIGWHTNSNGAFSPTFVVSSLPEPQTGKLFGGYYTSATDSNATMVINASGQVIASPNTITSNGTVWYARWNDNNGPFTVTFKCEEGGSAISGYSYSINHGATINVPAANSCSKEGHTFSNWKILANDATIANTTTTYQWNNRFGSDIVPDWQPIQTTITLNPNLPTIASGEHAGEIDGSLVNATYSDFGQTAIYTRYDDGVYRRNEGGVLSEQMLSGQNPLTSSPDKAVNITFNANGGQMVFDGTTYPNNGAQFNVVLYLPFQGYFLSGMNTPYIGTSGYLTAQGHNRGKSRTTPETWDARWEDINLTNTYFQAQNMLFNSLIPTRSDGYVFDGWYTAATGGHRIMQTGTGQIVEVIDSDTHEQVVVSQNIEWYAHWTPCAATANADAHAVRAGATSENGQCVYNLVCELCPDNAQDCYSQLGGTDTTYSFNFTTAQTSGTLPLSSGDQVASCSARSYNINYVIGDNATLPSSGTPMTYTYGEGATINGVPTKPNEEFQGWCTSDSAQTCPMTQTLDSEAHGHKTFWALWDCAFGYRKYAYDTITTVYDGNGGYAGGFFAAGTCAPIRYRVMCDKNCPSGETCNACLEDFNFGAANTVNKYSLGFAYNGITINQSNCDSMWAGDPLPAPVYHVEQDPQLYINNFTQTPDPKYAELACWIYDSEHFTNPVGNYTNGNYVTFMQTLAGETYNQSINFGATHYEFDGLWTADGSQQNGDGIQYVNSSGWVGQGNQAITSEYASKFFVQDTPVYAHWKPKVYTITLDKQDGNGGLSHIYEKYNTGWSYQVPSSTNPNVTYQPAEDFTFSSSQIPSKTGHDFGGYWTETSCGGTLVVNANGTMNVNANNGTVTETVGNAKFFGAAGTLYACWNPQSFEITLDNANATTNGTATIYTKYGVGVYLNSGLTHQMTPNPDGTYPITAPARSYTVTYDLNYTGKPNDHPADGTSNYPFSGYYVSNNQYIGSDSYITTSGVNVGRGYLSNQTWNARWGSGTAVTLPSVYDSVSTYNGRPGYIFTGWYAGSGTSRGDAGGTYVPTASETLYAHWDECNYSAGPNSTAALKSDENPNPNNSNQCVYTVTCTDDYLGPGNTHSFTAYGTANVATGTLPGCDVNGAYPITYDYRGGSGVFAYPDYIPFNGSQYIDTGIKIKKGYTITAQFEPTQSGTYLYGARGTNVPNASAYISNNANWRWGDDGIMVSGVSVSTGSVHTSVQNDSGVQIDNGAVQSYTGGTLSNFETPVTLAIGANHTGASTYASAERFVGNLYSFQIRDNNNNLVYDGVPVQNMVTLEYGLCNDVTKECVTFDASGTTTTTALPTRHVYGTATTVSGYAMRVNHVFAGWCDSQDSSHCSVWPASYVIGTEEQRPVTLEAQWSCNPGYTLVNNSCVANTINITYANGGHGTAPQSQSCTYGESNLTFPGAIVVDDGYEFNKWRVGESGPEYYDFDPFVCNEQYLGVTSGSVTVTATWNPKVYDITYNYNGGSRSLLPTGYTQLDYIESDNGQYINTGIKYGTSESVKYNIDFKVNTFTQAGLWGALNNKRTGTIWLNSNAFKVSMGGTQSSNSTIAIPFDTDRHVAVFSAGLTSSNANVNLLFDNHSYTMPYTYDETYMGKDQDIMLFYGYGGSYQPAQMRVYNFQIYLDDKLVFNGIPAQHGTDVGLYDTVSGEFFTSVPNNTNFVAGTPTATAAGYPEHYTHGVGATVYGVPTRANSVFQGWCRNAQLTGSCPMPHEITTLEHADVPLWAKWSCDPGYELNGTGAGQQCTPRAYSMNYTCSDGDEIGGWTYKGTVPTSQTAYYLATAPIGATLPALNQNDPCRKVHGQEGASDYCEDCFNFLGWKVLAEVVALPSVSAHAAGQIIQRWGETNNTAWCDAGVNSDWGNSGGMCATFADDNPFTLYPYYAPKEYPITYMYATTPGANGSLPSMHTYTQPTSISGEGMQLANARFTGWCKNSPDHNCTSGEYYYQTSVGAYEYGPITYYAQWECNEGYELSYDENDNPVCNQATFDIHYVYDVEHGGALMSGYDYPSQYTHGTATRIPAGATRPNSVFQSWCTNLSDTTTCQTPTNDYAYVIGADTTGPVTLYAKWSCDQGYTLEDNSCNPNTIRIVYANGGHGGTPEPAYTECTYGTNTEQWADALFETGYVFGGWSINSGLQAAGTPIVCDHTTLGVYGGSVTATASWSAQGYTVTYSCGTGTGTPPLDGNVSFGGSLLVAYHNDCERVGYRFKDWEVSGTSNTYYNEGDTITNWQYTEDKTFTARWEFNPVFTVTTVPMSASEADAAKRTISFDLAAKGTFYVDWDGEGGAAPQEIISTTTNTTRYTHTYVASEFGGESTKSFVIQFAGRATEYYSGASSFYTRPGIKFFNGTLDGSTVTVDGTEVNIAGISGCLGCIFPTLGTTGNTQQTQTRFYQTFRNAKNMAGSIPATLFGDVAGQTIPYMFSQTFWGCERLTGQIPAGLFGNVTGAPKTSIFGHTFNGCKGLSGQIPAGLFANISGAPAQYMFYYTFNGCENLTGIPAGLFNGISGAPSDAMFTCTFANCTNLTGSIPAGLFGGISGAPAINMYNSTFINCKKLSGSIPAGLFGDISGDAKKSMFNGTFYGCEELTGQIPGTLFKGNGTGISGVPAESMFASTFASCKKLTGPIPSGLFGVPSGAPQKNMFYYTFSGATLLNGAIPDRLFGDISGVPAEAMFYGTFQKSGVSGQIPANLFKGNGTGLSGAPQKNMFRSTFYNCPNLTGEIPSSLFGAINGTAAEGMFRYTFRNCSGLTGTIPSTLFGTLSGSAADMFAYTFYGDTHLTGYVPAGLFSNITVPTSLETAPTDMMTDIFYNTGLATECPCGTLPVETGLRNLYWRKNSATIPPRAISCAVDTSGAFYWYDGQCSEVCPATSIDELHVGSGLTYVTLKDKIKTPSINVRYTDPTIGDTTCYVPMVAGDGGTNSLNMLYAGNVHHAAMATTTPPADFGQR